MGGWKNLEARRAYDSRPDVKAKKAAYERRVRRKRPDKFVDRPTPDFVAPESAGGLTLQQKLRRLEELGLDWLVLPKMAAGKFNRKLRATGWNCLWNEREDLKQIAAEAILIAILKNPFDRPWCREQYAAYLLKAGEWRLGNYLKHRSATPEAWMDHSVRIG